MKKLKCKYCGNYIEIYGDFQWVVCACGDVMEEPLTNIRKRQRRGVSASKKAITTKVGGKK